MNDLVSIIIPTCCNVAREDALLRAIRSCLTQTYRQVEVIVAVNGDCVDEGLLTAVRSMDKVRTVQVSSAGQRDAMVAARQSVAGSYFCFLDDDDELLPESVERRLHVLREQPEVDAVTGNGTFQSQDHSRLVIDAASFSHSDLFGALLRKNWNASCATLFRTTIFGPEFFSEDYRHHRFVASRWLPQNIIDRGFSWTFATAKLALHHTVKILEQPTYVVHVGQDSTSESPGAMMRAVAVWYAVQSLRPPKRYQRNLSDKLARSHHRVARISMADGNLRTAWRHHLASMSASRQPIRYVGYTMRLISVGAMRRMPHAALSPPNTG